MFKVEHWLAAEWMARVLLRLLRIGPPDWQEITRGLLLFSGSGAIGNVTGEGEGDPDGVDHRRCSAASSSGSPISEMFCFERQ
jgi:hypothetical protein